jgi:hypothetical protein
MLISLTDEDFDKLNLKIDPEDIPLLLLCVSESNDIDLATMVAFVFEYLCNATEGKDSEEARKVIADALIKNAMKWSIDSPSDT